MLGATAGDIIGSVNEFVGTMICEKLSHVFATLMRFPYPEKMSATVETR